jgi:hypothetical protein
MSKTISNKYPKTEMEYFISLYNSDTPVRGTAKKTDRFDKINEFITSQFESYFTRTAMDHVYSISSSRGAGDEPDDHIGKLDRKTGKGTFTELKRHKKNIDELAKVVESVSKKLLKDPDGNYESVKNSLVEKMSQAIIGNSIITPGSGAEKSIIAAFDAHFTVPNGSKELSNQDKLEALTKKAVEDKLEPTLKKLQAAVKKEQGAGLDTKALNVVRDGIQMCLNTFSKMFYAVAGILNVTLIGMPVGVVMTGVGIATDSLARTLASDKKSAQQELFSALSPMIAETEARYSKMKLDSEAGKKSFVEQEELRRNSISSEQSTKNL